jgi:murein DD-endopeptidase MepM/ murein hydrolase activator NlpD
MVTARRLLAALLSIGVVSAGAAASAWSSAAGTDAAAKASAVGIVIVVPGGEGASAGGVAAPPAASASLPGFAWGDGIVSTGAIDASATATATERGDADARASVVGVSLFGGEIQIGSVVVEASAGASRYREGGSVSRSSVTGLVVLGDPVDAGPLVHVPLADWGYAVVLEQASVREDGDALGYRGSVAGVRIFLTADHGGLPAGAEVLVGSAEAAARASKPAPVAAPKAASAGKPAQASGKAEAKAKPLPREPRQAPPGAEGAPPKIVLDPPAGIRPRLTQGGYVFPVYGPSAGYGDDFGAPRADTIWHHGNDIWAPEGTPVLAVADGQLFSVGWNDIGGQRLWLRDRQGNEFYYAHLSAFSPLAVDGAQVRAGDVVGFVGHTGDAEGTPFHLHFEVHPRELIAFGYAGVVDPYDYLSAWRRLDDASFDRGRRWEPPATTAPPAAAVLIEADDISTLSGLTPGALEALLEVPDLSVEAGPSVLR